MASKDSHDLRAADIAAELLELTPAARDAALRSPGSVPPELIEAVRGILRLNDQAPGFLENTLLPEDPLLDQSEYGLRPGSLVGRYRIRSLIGRGGMADVYEAVQPGIDGEERPVALKLLRPGQLPADAARRFRREVRAIAMLDHPGICKLLDSGVFTTDEGPRDFCVLELIRGLPITQHTAANGLNQRARLELFLQVCDAIEYAHLQGVMHRDIKPANILIDANGRARMLDFGIARLLNDTAGPETGRVLGTPGYMSPEQLLSGAAPLDLRTDVYSLGAVLHELLCGHPPHEPASTTLHEFIRRVTQEDPPPLSRADPRLRGDLTAIVAAALQRDRNRRYPTVHALAADIRCVLESRPIALRNAEPGYIIGRFVRRHRVAAAAAFAAALALVVGGAGVAWQAAVAREAARLAERRAENVVNLANTVVVKTYMAVMGMPGSSNVLSTILGDATKELDRIVADSEDHPQILAAVALTYRRLANVTGSPVHPGFNDYTKARQLIERARIIAESACRKFPKDASAWSALGNVCYSAALLETTHAGAVTLLRQSVEHGRRAAALGPPDSQRAADLAHALHVLGELLPTNEAEPLMTESLGRFMRLRDDHPGDPGWMTSYAIAQHEMAEKLHDTNPDAALRLADQCIELLDTIWAIVTRDGTTRDYLHSWGTHRAGAFGVRAAVLLQRGDARGALSASQASEQVSREVLAADPENSMRRLDLARVLARAAMIRFQLLPTDRDQFLAQADQLAAEAHRLVLPAYRGEITPYVVSRELKAIEDLQARIADAKKQ
ncbi:MAG: serine/threonine protein kinase [Planctomycetes bacterium]|nr:serine/threonine protein kinase [Planctomycetota bacterium]